MALRPPSHTALARIATGTDLFTACYHPLIETNRLTL